MTVIALLVRLCAITLAAILLVPASASAGSRKLFEAAISVDGGTSFGAGTNKLSDVGDLFDTVSLRLGDMDYTQSSAVRGSLDLRGLRGIVSYEMNSTTLRFQIPGVLDVSFTGPTRDATQEEFEDWLRGEFAKTQELDAEFSDLLQAMLKHSPVDPVAGNPNSLHSRMVAADWILGTQGPIIHTSGEKGVKNLAQIGLGAGYSKGGDFSVASIDLPLGYQINFKNPKWSLAFDLPLTATFTEDQISGVVHFGTGVQFRPFDWWSLTGGGRIGVAASEDVGALAVLWSLNVTSHMRFQMWDNLTLGIGNMFGYSSSIDGVEYADLELDYDLDSGVTRNGGYLEGPLGPSFLGGELGWRFFGSHTYFFGEDLYMKSHAEVGLGLVTMKSIEGASYNSLSLDVSYLFGKSYNGVSAQLRWRF